MAQIPIALHLNQMATAGTVERIGGGIGVRWRLSTETTSGR
jgi:hypothetical protein